MDFKSLQHNEMLTREQRYFRDNGIPVIASWNVQGSEAHQHSEMEISVAIRGQGRYFIKDTAYDLQPGYGIIVPGNTVHYGIRDERRSLLRVVLIFAPSFLASRPAAMDALEKLRDCTIFALDSTETSNAELLFRNVEDEIFAKRDGWRDVVACELEHFLLIVNRGASTGINKAKIPNPIVKDVISHINETYAQKQCIEDIARKCCVSPSSLRRTFKRETGFGVKEFIIRIRINAAKKLLESSDAKVASVAYTVGYDSLSAFNREFRLVTGVSPSDYRRFSMK